VNGVGRESGGGEADWLAGPDVAAIAPRLLGALLAVHGVVLRLTEVEAYAGVGQDPASHAHRGPTPRNATMFGPAGRGYVYFSYGVHWCLNVVTGPTGEAAAVLLRAGAVVDGLALARRRRPGVADGDLARGPARLTRTLAVTGDDDGSALALTFPAVPATDRAVRTGPRVGVGAGAERPWRFWLDGEPSVSPYRAARPRTRPAGPAPG
jgi:DNA-3-methyladenine glycosylase